MRQNPAKAAKSSRDEPSRVGPIYRHLLDRERHFHARFGVVGTIRRPRYLLDALEAGETVTVPFWKVPAEFRPPECGETLTVDSGM